MKIKNPKHTKPAPAVKKSDIDSVMLVKADQQTVTFDELREALAKPDITDGALHESLIEAGYAVDID